ncbi:hypothetical protein K8I61_10055 [bacterium]|nr:hypothetical protein [bacterium]
MLHDWVIAKDCGYEIVRDGERIRFLNRDVLGYETAGWTFLLVAGLCLGGAGYLWFTTPPDRDLRLALAAPIAVGALFALMGAWCLILVSQRKRVDTDAAPCILIADTERNFLALADGGRVSRLADVRIAVRRTMSGFNRPGSYGGARYGVWLMWPGGAACVLRAKFKQECKRVQRALWLAGVGNE